jgi:hypothetical protein
MSSKYVRVRAIKKVDVILNNSLLSTTPAFTYLNVMKQGYEYYQRGGSEIFLRSLEFKLFLNAQPPSTTSSTQTATSNFGPSRARFIIIYDRNPNKGVPVLGDILQDYASSGGNPTITPQSSLNVNNKDRFYPLWDKYIPLPAVQMSSVGNTATTTGGVMTSYDASGVSLTQPTFYFNETINLGGLITQFYQTLNNGTSADIQTGALFLFAYHDGCNPFGGTAQGASFNYTFSSRLNVYDE